MFKLLTLQQLGHVVTDRFEKALCSVIIENLEIKIHVYQQVSLPVTLLYEGA